MVELYADKGEQCERTKRSMWSESTNIIMILSAKVDRVDIHATVVRPVVSEGDDELDADLGSSIDYLIEFGNVDARSSI